MLWRPICDSIIYLLIKIMVDIAQCIFNSLDFIFLRGSGQITPEESFDQIKLLLPVFAVNEASSKLIKVFASIAKIFLSAKKILLAYIFASYIFVPLPDKIMVRCGIKLLFCRKAGNSNKNRQRKNSKNP
ncbi:MAG: hypothetical protein KKB51_08115 [Candidatus Riflebacteria bacterium]|nr:hypothetical protein [Candidatus Riflebacteria bacterium]